MPARNAPCSCGKPLRFKHCCGRVLASPIPLDALFMGLRAQLEGRYQEAVRCYDHCLTVDPRNFDALHMRAVALYQMGCLDDSLAAFRSLAATHSALPREVWTNIGLLTAAARRPADEEARAEAARERYRAWKEMVDDALGAERGLAAPAAPGIGVVVASYNHAAFVEDALQSVATQSHLPQELIVIDDGSSDGSPALIERALRRFPSSIRIEFIVRENRGAAVSFNEAISRLSTPWVAPLNSDDRFHRERLARLGGAATRLQGLGVEFLFGSIDLIDANGDTVAPPYSALAGAVMASHRAFHGHDSVGLGLLAANCTVSTGNQFFSRSLWSRLGGYSPLHYNHDWDFALRGSLHSEPVHVPEARYAYRIHGSNTIAAAGKDAAAEARALTGKFVAASRRDAVGIHAPTLANWGAAFMGVAACVDTLPCIPDLDRHALHVGGTQRHA